MTPFLGPLLEIGAKLIDKLIPDPQAKAAAQLELFRMQQAGEFKQMETDLQLALGQMEINKVEAGSDDPFRAGWRPMVGWICAGGLGYQIILRPLLIWLSSIYGFPEPPGLEMETLMTLLFGMLGLGAYRTQEKLKGLN